MGIIEAKWNEEQCRAEYGVFFANDECILLEGSPGGGYTASARISASSLIETEPDGWADLTALLSCHTEKNGLAVLGGETSWEGDGFLALVEAESNNLIWVMHLYQSEKFVKVDIDGENILAVSEEYPHKYRWQIPLYNPERLLAFS